MPSSIPTEHIVPQTKAASPAPSRPSRSQSSMTAFARGKQEMARRILYSKFLRGQVIVSEDLDKIPGASDQPPKVLTGEAGSSFSIAVPDSRSSSVHTADGTVSSESSVSLDAKKKESKEEKARRRAEKAAKKERSSEKKELKQAKLERKEEKRQRKLATEQADGHSPAPDGKLKQKKSKGKGKDRAKDGEVTIPEADGEGGKDGKKRKRETRPNTPAENETSVVDGETAAKPKKKKRRKTEDEV